MINGRPHRSPLRQAEDVMTYVIVASKQTVVSKPFTC
jgi:hypothetical protein